MAKARIFAAAGLLGLWLPYALMGGTHFSLPLAVFSHDRHPSPPLEKYAAGDLGVVVPSYARSYLYTAYRWMEGAPMEPAEQAALTLYWKVKLELEEELSDADFGLWSELRGSLDFPVDPAHRFDGISIVHGRNFVQYEACGSHAF